jgi:hypothetical protein
MLPADGVWWIKARSFHQTHVRGPPLSCPDCLTFGGKVPKTPEAAGSFAGTSGADFSTASGRVCAIQSLMQQALLGPKHPPFRADRTNRLAPAGIPIIPTHVLDRSLTDANHVTDMVPCRKAVNRRCAGSAER